MEQVIKHSVHPVDKISQRPLSFISYILAMLRPSLSGGSIDPRIKIIHSTFLQRTADLSVQDAQFILVGSRGDGLNGKLFRDELSDVDVILIIKSISVGTHLDPKLMYDFVMETTQTYPGYLRLLATESCHVKEEHLQLVGSGLYFKNSACLSWDNFEHLGLIRSGPANTWTIYGTSFDVVPTIYCSFWPEVAQEWQTRCRFSEWPPQELQAQVVHSGCGAVAVPHRDSTYPSIEWRMSFVLAEQLLAKSVNEFQIQCFAVFKELIKFVVEPHTSLSTYCIKTIMFWTLEKVPVTTWHGQCGQALGFLVLLDELIACLVEHNIPHYFIPRNNLIAHIPTEHTKNILVQLIRIRKYPLRACLEYISVKSTQSQTVDLCKRIIHCWTPITHVIRKEKRPDIPELAESVRNALVQLTMLKLRVHDFEGAVTAVNLRSYNDDATRVGILNGISSVVTSRCTSHGERVDGLAETLCCIAVVHSLFSMRKVLKSLPVHAEEITGSMSNFEVSLRYHPLLMCTYIYYSMFLRTIGKHQKAIIILQECLRQRDNLEEFGDHMAYLRTANEMSSLQDEFLKLEMHNIVCFISSKCLVYYRLMQCYIEAGGHAKQIAVLMEEFKCYAECQGTKNPNQPTPHQLLAYCYVAVGRFWEAAVSFWKSAVNFFTVLEPDGPDQLERRRVSTKYNMYNIWICILAEIYNISSKRR